MTQQVLSGFNDLWLPAGPPWAYGSLFPTAVDQVLDAAGEVCYLVGNVVLPARTGSKTISAAGGGLIHWMPGAATITFANASTNLRVGIQDVSTSGGPPRGDGTHDVYADLVGGTDTITAQTWRSDAMESGTKTITHGDKVAIAWDMTARGGTDLVRVGGARIITDNTSNNPGSTLVTSGPTYTAQAALPFCVLAFDDGTLGYIDGAWFTSTGAAFVGVSINTGSTPDEVCNIFRTEGPVSIDALKAVLSLDSFSADLELILYSDPLGTPSVVEALTFDASHGSVTGAYRVTSIPLTAVRALSANTDYAVAIRPTTANGVTYSYFDVSAAGHFGGHSLGANCYFASRSNQTGAFSGTTTRRIHGLAARVCSIGDDVGGAGGGGGRIIGG